MFGEVKPRKEAIPQIKGGGVIPALQAKGTPIESRRIFWLPVPEYFETDSKY
jgi:hypothetical protein